MAIEPICVYVCFFTLYLETLFKDRSLQANLWRKWWRSDHASPHKPQPDPVQLLQTEEGQMYQQEIPGHIQKSCDGSMELSALWCWDGS